MFLWINITVNSVHGNKYIKVNTFLFLSQLKKIVLMQITQSSVQHVSSNQNGAANMNMPYS